MGSQVDANAAGPRDHTSRTTGHKDLKPLFVSFKSTGETRPEPWKETSLKAQEENNQTTAKNRATPNQVMRLPYNWAYVSWLWVQRPLSSGFQTAREDAHAL